MTHSVLETNVDVDLIAEVAQEHDMGAGALKGALESDHPPRTDNMEDAINQVRQRQIERERGD